MFKGGWIQDRDVAYRLVKNMTTLAGCTYKYMNYPKHTSEEKHGESDGDGGCIVVACLVELLMGIGKELDRSYDVKHNNVFFRRLKRLGEGEGGGLKQRDRELLQAIYRKPFQESKETPTRYLNQLSFNMKATAKLKKPRFFRRPRFQKGWTLWGYAAYGLSLVVIVTVATVIFVRFGISEPSSEFDYVPEQFGNIKAQQAEERDALILHLKINSADPFANRVQFNMRVYPGGKYRLEQGVPSMNLTLISDGITRKFTHLDGDNVPVAPIDYTVITRGNVALYPFDFHTVNYTVYAYENNVTTATIPLAVSWRNVLEGFDISSTIRPNDRNGFVITVQLSRLTAAKVYSIFTAFVMWTLALTVFRFASDGIFDRNKKVEGPVMGACIAMLFALPALRNTQPGAPPIGCIADIYAFFWAEFIIAVTAVAMMILYIIRSNQPTPVPTSTAARMRQQQLRGNTTGSTRVVVSGSNLSKGSPQSRPGGIGSRASVAAGAAAFGAGGMLLLNQPNGTITATSSASDLTAAYRLDNEDDDGLAAGNAMDIWDAHGAQNIQLDGNANIDMGNAGADMGNADVGNADVG
ncbi:hypothetical protein HK102_013986, partial [Quaeritorhiza haematococci]